MLVSEPGDLGISIAFSDTAIPLHLLEARVRITTTTTAGASGVIAGLVTQEEITLFFLPRLAETIEAAMVDDCHGGPPDCGCAPGSSGQVLQSQFDPNDNCQITASEVSANSLIGSLLASDTMVGETPTTSFGLRFTAVNATFTP
jgi:hypothetical protein